MGREIPCKKRRIPSDLSQITNITHFVRICLFEDREENHSELSNQEDTNLAGGCGGVDPKERE
jgi:hypothetical protein